MTAPDWYSPSFHRSCLLLLIWTALTETDPVRRIVWVLIDVLILIWPWVLMRMLLGLSVAREGAKPAMRVVETVGLRTGTDNLQVYEAGTGTGIDLSTVTASGRSALRHSQSQSMVDSGVDKYDIPAFLRRQQD